MGDDMSAYEEEMLELERKKLEALRGIRKTLKHRSRMEGINDLMERMDVGRDDVETLASLAADHLGGGGAEETADEPESDDLTARIASAISAATGKNVEVDVEVDDEEE